ncbi:hypothetical protein D9M70_626890 [compost metagenome]
MTLASAMRSTVAAMMPTRMTFLRCSVGSPAAARPMTTALSPARTRSMTMTCRSAAKPAAVKISMMRQSPDVP